MRIQLAENSYPPDLVQQRHAHAESTVTLVLAGALEENVGRTHEFARPLSVVIKPADTEHANRVRSAGARTLQMFIPQGALADELNVLGEWRWQHAGPIAQQFVRLLSAYRAKCTDLDSHVIDLLAALRPVSARAENAAPSWLNEVRQNIDDLLPRVVRVQRLATDADVHPVYLARQFRRFYGCSVTDYIARRRAQEAATLLARTDINLSSVAYRAGYADQSHLCRSFRCSAGVTPRAYRQLVASVQYSNGQVR